MVRLDDVTVKGEKGASLVLPPACVCGAALSQPMHRVPIARVPTCSECGGSLLRPTDTARPEGQERRHLQDFLSAFV
jgi:hypothetical protein